MTVGDVTGRVGLPAPISELAARDWDAIVVGGGHNGLTAAAYLARAGRSVLVLERRDQLGGACTLERPFSDPRYRDQPVRLRRRAARPGGGRSSSSSSAAATPSRRRTRTSGVRFPTAAPTPRYVDPARTADHLRAQGFDERDVAGLAAFGALFDRARDRLRAGPAGDTWLEPSPSRAEMEALLGDEELIRLVFEDSIAEMLERYVDDQRLSRRDRAAGDDRDLRRAARPGHGVDPADAPPGQPARTRLGVGLCRRRHRAGLVRDRRCRDRGRRPARRRGARGADHPRRGGRARDRRADPGAQRGLQRRPEAAAGDAATRARCPTTIAADSRPGRWPRRC